MKPATFFDVVAAMRNRAAIIVMNGDTEVITAMPVSISMADRTQRNWKVNIANTEYLWPEDNSGQFKFFVA